MMRTQLQGPACDMLTLPFDSVPPHRPAMPAGSLRGRAPDCLAAGQHPFLSPFTLGPRPFSRKALLMCSEEWMTASKCLFIFVVCISRTRLQPTL